MIVRRTRGALWLFRQVDHAEMCGRMAEAWDGADLPPGVPIAARHHDDGWTEWDERPRLDPATGWPHPYSDMPPRDYREIWRRGVARGWVRGEVVGLLVSLHGTRFFARRDAPADLAFLREERHHQADAMASLGHPGDPERPPPPVVWWHAWMFFWDALSLCLCEGWDTPWEASVPGADGAERTVRTVRPDDGIGGRVTLDPFPFRCPLELSVPARRVAARRYAAQGELDRALAGGESEAVTWRVTGAQDATETADQRSRRE